ncbi:hypothetical protein JOS77_12805 [Chromobacterium haemolyticum]|nr:hypothetical protein JOS77_12805 [Chromobacterium haemolyticum]
MQSPSVRRYTPAQLMAWQAQDQLSKVPAQVDVSYHDPASARALRTASVRADAKAPGGKASSADIVKLTRKAAGKRQAEQMAAAELERRQLERTRMSITVDGSPQLAAGSNIDLDGFGKLSGRYQIQRASHRISRQDGYVCELELKRVSAGAAQNTANERNKP